jgi:hypothetical protein
MCKERYKIYNTKYISIKLNQPKLRLFTKLLHLKVGVKIRGNHSGIKKIYG